MQDAPLTREAAGFMVREAPNGLARANISALTILSLPCAGRDLRSVGSGGRIGALPYCRVEALAARKRSNRNSATTVSEMTLIHTENPSLGAYKPPFDFFLEGDIPARRRTAPPTGRKPVLMVE